jgi:prepilin-type N-terminal cleavage/methylation domain-containing protein
MRDTTCQRCRKSKPGTRNSKSETSRYGFSLIELLIVVAIIGILVSIVVPAYKSSVRKANEASAIGTLNAIRVAQAKYVVDHKGQYGTIPELFEQGYLDKRFNSEKPHNRGYVFLLTLIPKTDEKTASFQVNANPEQSQGIGATGRVFFYVDPEGGICFSHDGPASAADEVL